MFKQTPFPFSILILAILITFYSAGSYFSLYWFFPQFDLLLHILAGLWIALVILWLAASFGQVNSMKEYKAKSFLIAFISAVLLGIVWELLENIFQLSSVNTPNYALDTSIDIFTDAFGGVLAYLYFVQRKRNKVKIIEVIHPFKPEVKEI
jgi:hypothetical protein